VERTGHGPARRFAESALIGGDFSQAEIHTRPDVPKTRALVQRHPQGAGNRRPARTHAPTTDRQVGLLASILSYWLKAAPMSYHAVCSSNGHRPRRRSACALPANDTVARVRPCSYGCEGRFSVLPFRRLGKPPPRLGRHAPDLEYLAPEKSEARSRALDLICFFSSVSAGFVFQSRDWIHASRFLVSQRRASEE